MNFIETLFSYKQFTENLQQEINTLRLETIVESLKDWSEFDNLEGVKSWFIKQQNECPMTIENIPLMECKNWSYNEERGILEHDSKEFFYLQGIRVINSKNREVVQGWEQPILTQVGFNGGILGLIRKKINSIPYYLVHAKAEPGNPDIVQISPTMQATFSNLKQAHQGEKPKFANFFQNPQNYDAKILFNQWMSEDGGRLHLKRNKGMIIEIQEDLLKEELPISFKWLSLYQIKELIKINSWVSPHIRSIISHL